MKRLIFLALVGMILLAVAALGYKIVRVSAEKDAAALRIRTLPDFRFFTDSTEAIAPAHVPPEKALVIIHFLPDCHFCQGEAKELAANAALFGGAHFLWVSAAESKQIREFGAWAWHIFLHTLSPAIASAALGRPLARQAFPQRLSIVRCGTASARF